MSKAAQTPPEGFQPIEVNVTPDKGWTPIEVTPPTPKAAPVAVVPEPVTGKKEH